MSQDDKKLPADRATALVALENIRRMLKGEVPFPTSITESTAMVQAGVPVSPPPPEDPPFLGTADQVVAGFEGAARRTESGVEYWSAVKLMELLGYSTWENFEAVINRAYIACNQSGLTINEHFAQITAKIDTEAGVELRVEDIHVTRYGAYLIAQNGDAKKKQVAFAQTYFASQTRRQEIADRDDMIIEQQRRVALRDEITRHNKDLADAAKHAGVIQPIEYAAFQNAGYRGLYDGRDVAGIRTAKKLDAKAKILDHMGSTELAANLFRATQTEEKLRREGIKGKSNANEAHYEVGQKVRKAIADIGGTMPENLEAADDINKVRKQLAAKSKKQLR